MNIVIIEDERLAAERLSSLLKQVLPEVEIKACLESVEESISWLVANPSPDLIFMDIQLDDGISFEIFDVMNIDSPVIFTTAWDQYAIRAFKVNSVDYLLKPIDAVALKVALEKYQKLYNSRGVEKKISKVIEQLAPAWKTRFFVKAGNRFQSVPVEEIEAFYSEEGSTFIRTHKGRIYAIDFSLDHLQKVVNPDTFFRISRSYIIHIDAISEIISYSTTRLKLKLKNFTAGDMIVSREKVSLFKQWLDR